MKPRKTWPHEQLPRIDVSADLSAIVACLDPARLVVLAGAGVSVDEPAWLPTARDFLSALYQHALPETFDWQRLLEPDCGPRFELVLDLVQRRFDPDLTLLDVFRSIRPNHNHRCLAALARAGALIVTTNFDVLIEAALAETGTFRCAYDAEHFAAAEAAGESTSLPTIWHLHGIVEEPGTRTQRPETIVASIRDVWGSRHLLRLDASKGAFLARALQERDLLVVGYSGTDDYDIVPVLETVRTDRKLIWVDHSLFNVSDGPEPSFVRSAFEGDCWYEAPSLNVLASIVDSESRAALNVGLLKYKTSHALQAVAGLPNEKDSPKRGPLPPRIPSILTSSVEDVIRGLMDVNSPRFRDLQLGERLIPWAEKNLPSRANRYLFAHELCRASGLKHETALLVEAMREESPPSQSRIGRVAGLAALHVAMTGKPPRLSDELLPFLGEFLETVRVMEPCEAMLEAAHGMFTVGYASGELDYAERCAMEALAAAQKAPNPAAAARASLLIARIAERQGKDDAAVIGFYEQASQAAYDSASQELVGLARGETGIYLWTRLVRRVELTPPQQATRKALWQTAQDLQTCRRALAEAYRIHAAQGDLQALKVIAGNLGDILDPWDESRARGLRAHCVCLFAAVKTSDVDGQRQAEERARDAAAKIFPELDASTLGGEELARVLLSKLDTLPDSQI